MDGLLRDLEALSHDASPHNTFADAASIPTVAASGIAAPSVPHAQLVGDWKLAYASNGHFNEPSLLASLLHLAAAVPGFGLGAISQRVSLDPTTSRVGTLLLENATTIELGEGMWSCGCLTLCEGCVVDRGIHAGPLGLWEVKVEGRVHSNGDAVCGTLALEQVALRPLRVLGLDCSQSAEVRVPLSSDSSDQIWCTTHLDEDSRAVRSGGFLYFFERTG